MPPFRKSYWQMAFAGENECYVSYSSQFGDNCIQNFHCGGLSSDIRYEIYFYIMGVEPLNEIFKRISDDVPKQMKILNTVIPILMRLYSLVSYWSGASCIKPPKGIRHQIKCDVINDFKLFPTVYCSIILSQSFDFIKSGVALIYFI